MGINTQAAACKGAEMINFTIRATNTSELSKKLQTLFNYKKRKITKDYILFTNFEKFYYHKNINGVYANFTDTKRTYNKALKLNLL